MLMYKLLKHRYDRWLDTTPTSRLIARCTQDIRAGRILIYRINSNVRHSNISEVDGPIPNGTWGLYGKITMVIIRFTAIVILSPSFLGPSILVALIGGLCGQIYMAGQMPIKRMMSNARSPILGQSVVPLTSHPPKLKFTNQLWSRYDWHQ